MKEFYVGQSASISKAFSQEEISLFSEISLDKNPVHIDERYAQTTMFKSRIVHGFLTGSLISAVIGTILPGDGAIYLHQDMDFRRPARAGELLTAIVTVSQIKADKHILYLDTVCTNMNNEIVIEGKAVVKY